MSRGWSRAEVEATVADYLDMLFVELTGKKYNKTEHRRNLQLKLDARSERAIESKHQNISAVLIGMGIPYINGYKPLYNFQRSLLPEVVSHLVAQRFELHRLLEVDVKKSPAGLPKLDFEAVLEEPPKKDKISEVKANYHANNINYLEREARNQVIGDLGEAFVLAYEKERLERLSKGFLADRIEHVARTEGPSAGYDIRSYNQDGSDKFIEVKATKYGKSIPFFVTPNELRFSQKNANRYFLYRVFELNTKPKMFHLTGDLASVCNLKPTEFMAVVG
ncbi:DUF3883 domain-containing protein [Oceanimonas sp. CHS3-5]|uniref:DUF3883 domain-containing protein n=1 Tax=Oceanimonas sp. CHS3-5 TaxID=3068186 RepID=UPI00273DD050|nr:DUF3883 domain-containing protein [Oceanimonas sp. CHS3-5]MDP5290891.1 DUF3883 domain-containing protein [Oceanimonas sp. CHS3-5]